MVVKFPIRIADVAKNRTEVIRISLTEFKGANLIDVRVMDCNHGEASFTKRGVSLRLDRLHWLIKSLQEADAEARKHGLLSDKEATAGGDSAELK